MSLLWLYNNINVSYKNYYGQFIAVKVRKIFVSDILHFSLRLKRMVKRSCNSLWLPNCLQKRFYCFHFDGLVTTSRRRKKTYYSGQTIEQKVLNEKKKKCKAFESDSFLKMMMIFRAKTVIDINSSAIYEPSTWSKMLFSSYRYKILPSNRRSKVSLSFSILISLKTLNLLAINIPLF